MKSARRHELQTNELADMIGRWVGQVRPYASWLLIGVVAVVGGWGLYQWYSASQQKSSGEGWRSFFLAMAGQDKEQIQKGLESVATEYGDSQAAEWALLVAADVDLSDGLQQLFVDKANATTALRAAAEKYEQVLKELDSDTDEALLRVRALFGLAQAKEALGEVDDAIKYYKQVRQAQASSVLAGEARERLAMLEDPQMQRWYFWFRRQEPKPPSAEQPGSGLPGTLPGLDSLKDFPDLGTGGSSTPDNDADKGADKGPVKSGDQGADKGAEKSADQSSDKGSDKGANKGTEDGAGKSAPKKDG